MSKRMLILIAILVVGALAWSVTLLASGEAKAATDFAKWAGGAIGTFVVLVWMFAGSGDA